MASTVLSPGVKSNHLQCTLIQFQERSPSTNQNTFSLDSMKVSWCSLPRPFRRKCQRRLNIKPGLVSTPQISQKQNPQIQQHRALHGRLLGLFDWAFLPAVGCRLIGNARVALSGMLTRLPSTQTNDTQRGGKGHKLLPAPYNSAAHQKKSKGDRWEDIKGDGARCVLRTSSPHVGFSQVKSRFTLLGGKKAICNYWCCKPPP